jgi:hypothetical protein
MDGKEGFEGFLTEKFENQIRFCFCFFYDLHNFIIRSVRTPGVKRLKKGVNENTVFGEMNKNAI